jgi:excisionase family DNA binding protein
VALKKVELTEKMALSVAESAEVSGTCKSAIYLAVAAGELRAKKRGTSTLILPDDLRAWIENLPDFTTETKSSRTAMATQARLEKSRAIEAPATPSRREAAQDRARAVAQRANPRRVLAAVE